jgi:glyoxylase-like metal-dependent hydrolase (beta-lactamase superfamily II)
MNIKSFVFSPFQVNTYIINDSTNECVIIDPACYDPEEQKQLKEYIASNQLTPKHLLFTHCHLDHVFGSAFVSKLFQLDASAHKNEEFNNQNAIHAAAMYGVRMDHPAPINIYLDESDSVRFGNSRLNILFIPGHTAGSLLYFNEKENFIISGDVLFQGSIGRTDLPGGDYSALISGIKSKLFKFKDEMIVYPGHNESTTIGNEKRFNPFLS